MDDIVVCTMETDYHLAHSHLQEICDSVVAWRLYVKLVFNGVKYYKTKIKFVLASWTHNRLQTKLEPEHNKKM